ncbi:MAG TPA: MerR family transcriptional regulator [Patescibacteria group bacterium]|nr:MerR family transcriptional regulator [Patescibacteria group bacterium]
MSTQLNQPKNYTIRETAKLSGLTESTLRYYETIGLIPHIDRDSSSKYRVYSEDDVNYIVSIACLSATGMSIDGMKEYLGNVDIGDGAADKQIALLENQDAILAREEQNLMLRRKYLRTKTEYWKAVKAKDPKLAAEIAEKAIAIAREVKVSQTN